MKYFDVVSFSAWPSRSGMTVCTDPLPNVRSPISVARPWSRSAPATISDPDAEPPSTSTTSGAPASASPGGGGHFETRLGRAPVGAHDHAGIEEVVGDAHRRLEHAAGVAAQVEHEAAQRRRNADFGAVHEHRQGLHEVVRRGVTELRDADVAEITRQWLRAHRVHVHFATLEVNRAAPVRPATDRQATCVPVTPRMRPIVSSSSSAVTGWSLTASTTSPERTPAFAAGEPSIGVTTTTRPS